MTTLAALGWQEILLFLLVLLLMFGSTKLPQLARSLGSSVSEFKKGIRDDQPGSGSESKNDKNDKINGSH
jgi:sec-independent protein translocase protein TatA